MVAAFGGGSPAWVLFGVVGCVCWSLCESLYSELWLDVFEVLPFWWFLGSEVGSYTSAKKKGSERK